MILSKPDDFLSDRKISWENISYLFSSATHSPFSSQHRSALINKRVTLISWLFSVLVLIWSPIDYLLLPDELSGNLFLLRLSVSASLILIALSVCWFKQEKHAYLRLTLMMLVASIFFGFEQVICSGIMIEGAGGILIGIYNLLPFLIIAGLAIFPLTFIEVLVTGIASLMVMMSGIIVTQQFSLSMHFPMFWMLLLIMGIDALSAAIQLNHISSLLHRVSRDALTGAFTRHTGQELIDLHFQISLEEQRPFAIAFIDLDHFKSINDDYGHEAGDTALSNAVKALKRLLRRGDMVIRWGGEEFLVVLQDADKEGAGWVLKRIHAEWLGKRPDGSPLTASIGLAERISDKVDDPTELVSVADQRMYQAKQNGRAQSVLS